MKSHEPPIEEVIPKDKLQTGMLIKAFEELIILEFLCMAHYMGSSNIMHPCMYSCKPLQATHIILILSKF